MVKQKYVYNKKFCILDVSGYYLFICIYERTFGKLQCFYIYIWCVKDNELKNIYNNY